MRRGQHINFEKKACEGFWDKLVKELFEWKAFGLILI